MAKFTSNPPPYKKEMSLDDVINQTGKKIKVVACVIRNDGTGWKQIIGSHTPLHLLSVTNDTSKISVHYDFTAKNVISFVACPDEMMSADSYFMGSSVGTSQADISLYQNKTIGGYISYNGSSWSSSGANDNGISASFSGGILTITHPPVTGVKASIVSRDGTYIPCLGALGSTTTQVIFKDYAGATINTQDANMKVYFERSSSANVVDPNTYVNAGGNIWCYGIFEVE
jgi:hypothetical protein